MKKSRPNNASGQQTGEVALLARDDTPRVLGNMMALGRMQPTLSVESLDARLRDLWHDMMTFTEERPSDQLRLASQLLKAIRLLITEGTDDAAKASSGRHRLATGAKSYIEGRGGTWTILKQADTIAHVCWIIEHLAEDVETRLKPLFPEGERVSESLLSPVLAHSLIRAWTHETWDDLRLILKEKRQPVSPPSAAVLQLRLTKLLKPAQRESWQALSGRILVAMLNAAGVERVVADTLVLRPRRGVRTNTRKSEKTRTNTRNA